MKFLSQARRSTAALAVLAVCSIGLGSTSWAAPSDDDINRAKAAEAAAAKSVTQIEAELARVSAQSEQAMLIAQQAGEQLAQARDAADIARAEATVARDEAAAATSKVEEARKTLSQIATTAYRSGSNLQAASPYLAADGMQSVAMRQIAIELFGAQADRKMQTFQAVEQVAKVMQRRADEAEQKAVTAEGAVAENANIANAASDAAIAQREATAKQREELIVQLAEKRGTTVELERQRQDELDRQRREREEALAKKRAEEAAKAEAARVAAEQAAAAERAAAERAAAERAAAELQARPNPAPATPAEQPAAPAEQPQAPAPQPQPQPEPAPQPAPAPAPQPSGDASSALAFARSYIGVPYLWGGDDRGGVDCSGLMMLSFGSQGIRLPHSSRAQYNAGARVPIDAIQPGDILFWSSDGSQGGIFHVAMYSGNGMMVEAPYPGKTVWEVPVRYKKIMPFAVRL